MYTYRVLYKQKTRQSTNKMYPQRNNERRGALEHKNSDPEYHPGTHGIQIDGVGN